MKLLAWYFLRKDVKMEKRNISKITVMVFAFILIFTSISFADTNYDYTKNVKTQEKTDRINSVIEKMDKYVKYDEIKHIYYIDKTNLPSNITDEDVTIAETIIQRTNSTKSNLNSSTSLESKTLPLLAARGKKKGNNNKGGVTKLVSRWYGYDLYLNHYHCSRLYSYREFPAAVAGALVPASVIGVVAWTRAIHNADRGHGVVLKLVRIRASNSTIVGPVWVRGQ
jgi:hypothetical protein